MKWAHFRFTIIGPLLSAPPEQGALQHALNALAQKTWQHPITGKKITVSKATIERWYYLALDEGDPVKALHTKKRSDFGVSKRMSGKLKQEISVLAARLRDNIIC
jgi:hypothetical protein